jgi:hypothetical protein
LGAKITSGWTTTQELALTRRGRPALASRDGLISILPDRDVFRYTAAAASLENLPRIVPWKSRIARK